jgi:hypothetical protein
MPLLSVNPEKLLSGRCPTWQPLVSDRYEKSC